MRIRTYTIGAAVFLTTLNLISVSIFDSLAGLMMSPDSLKLLVGLRQNYIGLASQFGPFPIVFAAIIAYLWPVIRALASGTPPAQYGDRAKKRLLNSPIILVLFSAMGWVIGTVLNQILVMEAGLETPPGFFLDGILVSVVLTSIVFILGYYLLELLVRQYLIGQLFPEGDLIKFPGVHHWTIRRKLVIFLYACAILPGIITYRMVYHLNNSGDNALHQDVLTGITVLYGLFFLFALVVLWLKSRGIARPVGRMEEQVRRIDQGNFTKQLMVESTDELGRLTDGVNQMTRGLAEKERITEVFGRAVDPRVRDYLLNQEIRMGGESREVTILFTDLQGFTQMSEKMDPATVVDTLNRYFTALEDKVTAHGGVINKFIGDAILAVFGAPLPGEPAAMARGAIQSGMEILDLEEALNTEINRGLVPNVTPVNLRTRIGIHSGPVLAGNIGSEKRLEYTVIGDTVNTASRLEHACKNLDTQILISGATKQLAEQTAGESLSRLRPRGRVKLRGREEPLAVYSV